MCNIFIRPLHSQQTFIQNPFAPFHQSMNGKILTFIAAPSQCIIYFEQAGV